MGIQACLWGVPFITLIGTVAKSFGKDDVWGNILDMLFRDGWILGIAIPLLLKVPFVFWNYLKRDIGKSVIWITDFVFLAAVVGPVVFLASNGWNLTILWTTLKPFAFYSIAITAGLGLLWTLLRCTRN